MIINRADRYGLAQLYQLRGRIGRSDRRAYAFLHGAAGHRALRGGAQAPGRHPRVLRARGRVPHRRPRPGAARRGQPAGRRAERPHRGRRPRPLREAPGADDPRAQGTGAAGAAAGHLEPARRPPDPRELRARGPPAHGALQAGEPGAHGGRGRRAAGGDPRPLRRAAAPRWTACSTFAALRIRSEMLGVQQADLGPPPSTCASAPARRSAARPLARIPAALPRRDAHPPGRAAHPHPGRPAAARGAGRDPLRAGGAAWPRGRAGRKMSRWASRYVACVACAAVGRPAGRVAACRPRSRRPRPRHPGARRAVVRRSEFERHLAPSRPAAARRWPRKSGPRCSSPSSRSASSRWRRGRAGW